MKVSWEFLLNYYQDYPLPQSARSEDILNKYKVWKLKLKNKGYEINSYLHNKYLKNKSFSIDINPFPYNLEDNIYHYVLWINNDYRDKVTNLEIKNIIYKKMSELNCSGYVCFENHIDCKSVSKVLHFQIFFRKC